MDITDPACSFTTDHWQLLFIALKKCLFVVVVDFNHSAKVKNMDNDRLLGGVVAGFKERWTCRGYMQSYGLRFV